jgi:hypothetical protein
MILYSMAQRDQVRKGMLVVVGDTSPSVVTRTFKAGFWYKPEGERTRCHKWGSGTDIVFLGKVVPPWTVEESRSFGPEPETDYSILEAGDVVASFSCRLYADMTLAARYLLVELAESEGVELAELVGDIIRRNQACKAKA